MIVTLLNKPLKDIISRKDYIIPILPVFFVIPKDSDYRRNWLKKKSDALLLK